MQMKSTLAMSDMIKYNIGYEMVWLDFRSGIFP